MSSLNSLSISNLCLNQLFENISDDELKDVVVSEERSRHQNEQFQSGEISYKIGIRNIHRNLGKSVELFSYWARNIESYISQSQLLHELYQELDYKQELIHERSLKPQTRGSTQEKTKQSAIEGLTKKISTFNNHKRQSSVIKKFFEVFKGKENIQEELEVKHFEKINTKEIIPIFDSFENELVHKTETEENTTGYSSTKTKTEENTTGSSTKTKEEERTSNPSTENKEESTSSPSTETKEEESTAIPNRKTKTEKKTTSPNSKTRTEKNTTSPNSKTKSEKNTTSKNSKTKTENNTARPREKIQKELEVKHFEKVNTEETITIFDTTEKELVETSHKTETERNTTSPSTKTQTGENTSSPSNKTKKENNISSPSNKTKKEKNCTSPNNKTKTEKDTTSPNNTCVVTPKAKTEKNTKSPNNKTKTEKDTTSANNKTKTEKDTTSPNNLCVVTPKTKTEKNTTGPNNKTKTEKDTISPNNTCVVTPKAKTEKNTTSPNNKRKIEKNTTSPNNKTKTEKITSSPNNTCVVTPKTFKRNKECLVLDIKSYQEVIKSAKEIRGEIELKEKEIEEAKSLMKQIEDFKFKSNIDDSTNFVAAEMGFLIKVKAEGNAKPHIEYYHYPITFPNKNTFSIYDVQNEEFNYFSVTKKKLYHSNYIVDNVIIKPTTRSGRSEADPSNDYHSESVLFFLCQQRSFQEKMINKLIKDLDKRKLQLTSLETLILDIHSTNDICSQCFQKAKYLVDWKEENRKLNQQRQGNHFLEYFRHTFTNKLKKENKLTLMTPDEELDQESVLDLEVMIRFSYAKDYDKASRETHPCIIRFKNEDNKLLDSDIALSVLHKYSIITSGGAANVHNNYCDAYNKAVDPAKVCAIENIKKAWREWKTKMSSNKCQCQKCYS